MCFKIFYEKNRLLLLFYITFKWINLNYGFILLNQRQSIISKIELLTEVILPISFSINLYKNYDGYNNTKKNHHLINFIEVFEHSRIFFINLMSMSSFKIIIIRNQTQLKFINDRTRKKNSNNTKCEQRLFIIL